MNELLNSTASFMPKLFFMSVRTLSVAVAETSLKRKTGARGLRAIMENVMMDIMYKAPSDENLKYCLVTKEAVLGEKAPSTEKIEARPESA